VAVTVAVALAHAEGLLTVTVGGDSTTIFRVVVPLAHCPGLGVNVYVAVPAVDVLIVAGFQLPVILLLDEAGNDGAVEFRHNGPMGEKFGVTDALVLSTPEPDVLTQLVAVLVITTLYVPGAVVVKLATLPGLATPAGVVQT
jgi:hypothetical protein